MTNQGPLEKKFPLFAVYSDPVVITDADGHIVYVNPAFEDLTHYRLEDIVGATPRVIKSGKQDLAFYQRLWDTIKSGKVFRARFTNRKKNGDTYQLDETISPFHSEDGDTYFVSIGRDLTFSQHSALELQKLALVAEQSADHVLITTPDGIIEYVNPAFEALTGFSKEEAVGQNPSIIKSGQHPSEFYAALWNTILAGKVFRGISINKKKNGELYYEEKTITPIKDSNGQIISFVSVGRDITERIKAEEELKASREQLLMMNQILEKYTQPAVTKALDSGINPLSLPPRVVERTIFFTDMVQFSTLSENLSIGELVELVEKYLTICTHAIVAHGGEVIKFMGDGVMAYFPSEGADMALEAGLALIANLEFIRNTAPCSSPLSVLYAGVGIAQGRVTEGNIGSDIKKDYTVLGDTVNVASRLEALTRQVASPICITERVRINASEPWTFVSLGQHGIRGKGAAIDVYTISHARIRTSLMNGDQIAHRIQEFLGRANPC